MYYNLVIEISRRQRRQLAATTNNPCWIVQVVMSRRQALRGTDRGGFVHRA
jgi:hypothetical protein